MTEGGYPPGCSQIDHDHYFGDEEPQADEDAAYEEYRDSSEWYEDRENHLEVEPVDDGEDEREKAA